MAADDELDDRLEEIAAPWDDEEDEYRALTDLLVPVAQQRLVTGLQDWDAIDTKALGVLAAAVAALATLAAFHHTINRLWWIPAIGLVVSSGFFCAVIWPYDVEQAPDLFDLHDKMRTEGSFGAARELLNDLTKAADTNDGPLGLKVRLFGYGLVVLAVSLVGCLPILLIRPHL